MSGQKIIDGLKDAIEGNMRRVTIDGLIWARQDLVEEMRASDAAEIVHLMDTNSRLLSICRVLAEWDRSDGNNDIISEACSAARTEIAKTTA